MQIRHRRSLRSQSRIAQVSYGDLRESFASLGSVWSIGKPALGFDLNLRYFNPMTETEQAILDTLLELEDAVAQVNAEPKPDLVGLFGRLDDLTAQLPRGTSPDLLHYMHKKSYQKARLFLQGQDPEQGDCPH